MCADSFLLVFLKESTEPVSGQAVVIVLLWDIEFNVNWISDAPLQNKTLQLSACLGDRYHEIWSAVLITNDWSCLLALCWQLICCTMLFLSNKLITGSTGQCQTTVYSTVVLEQKCIYEWLLTHSSSSSVQCGRRRFSMSNPWWRCNIYT